MFINHLIESVTFCSLLLSQCHHFLCSLNKHEACSLFQLISSHSYFSHQCHNFFQALNCSSPVNVCENTAQLAANTLLLLLLTHLSVIKKKNKKTFLSFEKSCVFYYLMSIIELYILSKTTPSVPFCGILPQPGGALGQFTSH